MTHLHENIKTGKINTYAGQVVHLLQPDPETIEIKDIAYALSGIYRFGGHSRMTVAQHSVLTWYLAPPELKMIALLHDASEAYIGDIITPLKKQMPQYYNIEANFMAQIFKRFGLDYNELPKIDPYDWLSLELEFDHFFKKNSPSLLHKLRSNGEFFTEYPQIWNPEIAEHNFLQVFTWAKAGYYPEQGNEYKLIVIDGFPYKVFNAKGFDIGTLILRKVKSYIDSAIKPGEIRIFHNSKKFAFDTLFDHTPYLLHVQTPYTYAN